MIKEFRNGYRFLSNFFASPITVAGARFPTVEHAYQACKTTNPLEQLAIIRCATPGKAKRMGKHVTLRPDWGDIKLHTMRVFVLAKFEQNWELAERLFETYPQELVEGNKWHDTYWGKCYCPEHLGAGQNNLGKILMETRETLYRLRHFYRRR